MTRFEEDNLAFTFGASWNDTAIKFDDPEGDHKKIADSLEGTKGVDFLGIHQGSLFFLEVKDFRHYRIENKQRVSNGELTTEIAQKVKDSVACLIGLNRTSNHEIWQDFANLLVDKKRVIWVVLWLEQDLPRRTPKGREQVNYDILRKAQKGKLGWLTNKVLVCSLRDPADTHFDLQVVNLPRK